MKIFRHKYILKHNFQVNFFEVDLSTNFNEGVISIIAEQLHADHFKQWGEFELIPSKWNILRSKADKKNLKHFFFGQRRINFRINCCI
jgi:hypothetical protein